MLINFSSLQDESELKQLECFLRKQDLGYRNYQDWVERAIVEVEIGYKRTILARMDGRIVGDVIVQPHKLMNSLLEVKNVRIHPEYRGREFGRFMLKQAEEIYGKRYIAMIGDVREGNREVVQFLVSCGFTSLMSLPLYDDSMNDIIMLKSLRRGIDELINPSRILSGFEF